MTEPTRPRRQVLGALVAGTAGVAAAGVLPAAAVRVNDAPAEPALKASSRGYQVTGHVQRYYRLARF